MRMVWHGWKPVTAGTLVLLATGIAPAENSLSCSRYLGGSSKDAIRGIATDDAGNVYVTGGTKSPDFPVTPHAYDTTLDTSGSPVRDVFVAKLNRYGQIIWSTLIGGPNYDRAYAVQVDRKGYVYVAGRAGAGFPVTAGAFQPTFQGGQATRLYGPQDGFICKLNPDGTALVFCSYFGTSDPEIVRDLAVDAKGDIYLASSHSGGALPQSWFHNALQKAPRGGRDALIAKVTSDGSRVLWATYLGGSKEESGENSIRVDRTGHAYVLMTTRSTDIPTTPGAYDRTYNGGSDTYVAKLAPDGSRLVYGTYLGASRDEGTETHELAIDAHGNAYVASLTMSPDFPTTAGVFQTTYGGSGAEDTGRGTNYAGDVFVAKISADGARLLASTFVGGRFGEGAEGVAVDSAGDVYVSGATYSSNFPVTADAFQGSKRGGADAFLFRLSADFTRLVYSTYLGGTGKDLARTAAIDPQGNMYIAGSTKSDDWPTRSPFRRTRARKQDAVLAKITFARAVGGQPSVVRGNDAAKQESLP
ncbi:MAG: SBBP repeat-containing protein [Candidatus Binatia bacterium]